MTLKYSVLNMILFLSWKLVLLRAWTKDLYSSLKVNIISFYLRVFSYTLV
uniref:Uncharacterized protein n=1 Tax=Anguilla anguilla TaxID=7936 RepID=A0A0E9QES3_ANGAN